MPGRARRLTSETGDVPRGVLVAVVFRPAIAARPPPDAETSKSAGAGEAAAGRAGPGRVGFVHLGVGHPCVIAFVTDIKRHSELDPGRHGKLDPFRCQIAGEAGVTAALSRPLRRFSRSR